jgi:endogenous inhibitor of DNA gyrase (YacG/DUF329 family)
VTAAKSAPCPNCRQPAEIGPANPWRPFCSQRCKMSDLGGWFAERYSIPAEDEADPSADEPRDPPSRQ